jgi:hypothetical protein
MLRACVVVLALSLTAHAFAEEKPVAQLSVPTQDGKPPLDVVVTRARGQDGSVTIKLAVKGDKGKPLTVYTGGGDDDGYGDDELKSVKASPFALQGGARGVRVDLLHHIADGRKKDEQTDTTLVGFASGKPQSLIEVKTRTALARSKICHEWEETSLALEGNDLAASTRVKRESELGDDDLPIDKSCKSQPGAKKKIYKWEKDHFVDPEAEAAEE